MSIGGIARIKRVHAQAGRRGGHVLTDTPTTRRARLKRPHRKCMTKVVQAWTMTARCRPKTSPPQQCHEGALNRMVRNRPTMLANETRDRRPKDVDDDASDNAVNPPPRCHEGVPGGSYRYTASRIAVSMPHA
jgi:hypothetical protein